MDYMDYNVGMANHGRKLALGMEKVTEIDEKIFDLKILYFKMTPKQQALFKGFIKGKGEIEAFILSNQIGELSYKVPVVFDENGIGIKTSRLKITDLPRLSQESYECLKKIAQDHIQLAVGNVDYQKLLANIKWYFDLHALDAAETLVEIMGNEKFSPQTRVVAANSVLGIAGYRQNEQVRPGELPVRLIIKMPEAMEGEIVEEKPSNPSSIAPTS